jgi:hypothetical protein
VAQRSWKALTLKLQIIEQHTAGDDSTVMMQYLQRLLAFTNLNDQYQKENKPMQFTPIPT